MFSDLGLAIHVFTSALTQALRADDCVTAVAAFQNYLRNLPRGFNPARELGLTQTEFRNLFNAIQRCNLQAARHVLGLVPWPKQGQPPMGTPFYSLPRALVDEALDRADHLSYISPLANMTNQALIAGLRAVAASAPSMVVLADLLASREVTNWAIVSAKDYRPSRIQVFVGEVFLTLRGYPVMIPAQDYDAISATVKAWRLNLFPGAAP
jgi:hypothetical protein